MNMKKGFRFYLSIWAVLLVLFEVIAFVSPGWAGQEKYTASFWIGYVVITLAFVGQLVCAIVAFRADNLQKLFYRLPLFRVSYMGLVLSFLFGGLCMFLSPLPYWIGVILCAVVLACTAIAVLRAKAVGDFVSPLDTKIRQQTQWLKAMTAEAEGLVARAAGTQAQTACRAVYEALRYADPMSNDALAEIERKISTQFDVLARTVQTEDAAAIVQAAEQTVILIQDRGRKCKLSK